MADPLSIRRVRRMGFSLVQVLVSVSIVAVLSALAAPALQRARLQAASAACVGNLRELAAAHRLYESDHDGKPPPPTYTRTYPGSEGHSGPGIRLLRPYYRSGPKYVWDSGTFLREPREICPASRITKLSRNLTNGPDYDIASQVDKHYGLFYTRPSQRPLIWDGINGGAWTASSPFVPLRHAQGINCAFLDGHVEHIPTDDPRLFHRWWYYAVFSETPDSRWLGQGTPMGVSEIP